MHRKIAAVFAILCLCAWVSLAGDDHGKMDPAAHAAKLKAELNLNADQTAKVEKIFADFFKKAEPIHAKSQAAYEQLKALKSASPQDEAAIKAKESELQPIREQKHALMAERDAEMKKVLTPEQFTKYQELIAAHGKDKEHARHPK